MKRLVIVAAALFLFGCAHGGIKPKTKPEKPLDPVVKAKQEFSERYGFLVTRREKITYYQESLGVVDKENKIFEGLKTIEDLGKFTEVFWKVRDMDPNTPENEEKDRIDGNIRDIKNEIFTGDPQVPQAFFASNGGLKGDMAHVYLLYGMPHYKERLPQNRYHVDLMVWYYFDQEGKHLFRFLFYNKYGSYRLFKSYGVMLGFNYLIDPMTSPLKEISAEIMPSPQDLYDLWMNLIYYEPAQAFVLALFEFSHYSEDIVIENGDGKKRLGALDPPEPAALTAKRYKPQIVGEPGDLSSKEILFGKYPSFIPMYVRVTQSADGNPSLALFILFQNIDWEVKEGKAECRAALNINIINKSTAKSVQFSTALLIELAKAEDVKMTRSAPVFVDSISGATNYGKMKFSDFIKKLPAGDYVMDIDFFDLRTMKSGVAIQEFTK